MEQKKIKENLGTFTTGVIIACARRRNFFAEKFFSQKLEQKIILENNFIKKFNEFWQSFANENQWSKKIIQKFFNNSATEKNSFSENLLQKIKKIFADDFFGMTINSFTSVSLNPALISFCVDNNSANLEFFKKNRYFLLNILSVDQKELATAFATPKNSKKWTVEPYVFSKFGNPIFQNSLCYIECKKHKFIKMGDHHIIIGEIIDCAKISDKQPLVYFQSKYREIIC